MSLDDFNATRYDIQDEEQRQKKAQAIYNLHTAYGANPDDEAEKIKISRETGVPVEVMDDPEVRNDAGRQAFMKTVDVKDNPGTIDFLTYQQNAKVAMRQIREISGVERALRNLAVGATRDVLGSGIKGMGAIINARGRIAENIPGSQLPFEFGLPRLAHEIGLGDVLTNAGENIKQYYGQFAPKGEQAFGDQVASGVGQMVPQLAMFSNPFTAPLGVAMMAGQGTDQMAEKIAMDKESQKASQYRQDMELLSGGLITAVTEWATSKFQLKGLQALVLKNRLLDKTVKIVLGGVEEGAQEFSENLGQDLVHIAATNPDSQLALGQAIEAGEVGGIVGTIAQSVIQGALHIRTRGTQRQYQDLSDATRAQKLRDMEPGTYQDFVDRVTANLAGSAEGAVTDIYVDGNTFHQVMLERGFDPDEVAMAVPSIGQQMAEARATGGDIVIPLNEFAGKIAGTEIGDALEPHIRSTADAYSVAELDAATKFAPAFDEQMRSISEKTQAYRDWMASQKEVRDTVYNQLVETGTYTKAASRSFSALVGNFYATQAREMGMTPAELYARLPYKVLAGEISRGQMTQDEHGITYDQTGKINLNENFQKWFGDSKVVDNFAPMPVYHWTNNPVFNKFETNTNTGMIWFSESPKEFAPPKKSTGGEAVYPVYLKIGNPLDLADAYGRYDLNTWKQILEEQGVDTSSLRWDSALNEDEEYSFGYLISNWDKELNNDSNLSEIIQLSGFDGIHAPPENISTGVANWVAFEPTQIKSVNNRGTWNSNDPNILNQSFAGMSDQAAQIVESLQEGGLNITPGDQSVAPSNLLLYQSAAQDQTNTPEFKRWFEGSKVVDDNGVPKVVYSGHANTEMYGSKFDKRKSTAGGFYASEDPEIATGYAMGKLGSKEFYEHGSQYRLEGKGGKLNKKLWQYELSQKQKDKIDELAELQNEYGDYLFHIHDMRDWAKNNEKYEPLARRILYNPYDLQNIWEFNEYMGYNIAYAKEGQEPIALRQQKNETEELLDAIGIKWNAYDWHQPGVMPVFLNIKNPIDADKPFPQDVLAALKKKAKGERTYNWEDNKNWTKEFPLKPFIQLIEEGSESWTTQVPKKALAIFEQFGYDGIKERGQKGADLPREQRGINWIAFNPTQIKSAIGNRGTFDPNNPDILYQGLKRGGFDPERMTTVLTQQADYSTFLHESAHFFLSAYSQMAAMPEATPQIQEDMQTVLDWFGVKDLNEWNSLTLEQQRKHHEAFAYNFEIYLFGGKAPSIKMQGVFERFAAWLKKVYQSIRDELNAVYRQEHGTDLPVLTGEVKQVMDRMLASDQQIEQAEYAASMGAIFQTQAESGMDDATWAAYLDMQEEAHQDAVREHRKASMRQMKWLSGAKSKYVKLLQTEANFQRGKITEKVIKEVNEMPIYVAKDALKNATPTEQMAIADGMGYKSIEELKLAIANAPKKSAVVKEEVDRRMLEENGELVDPRMVEQKVNEAIHNEARQRFITVELRHLAKATQPVRIMQAAARMAAQKMLGRKTIFELRPRDYVAAEARAGKAAQEALKAGDFAGAVKAKENQLLQNALAVEAMKARGEVETALKNWKKLFRPDDKVAKTHDMNYVGVARAILAKYTYGKDPIGASDKPASYYVDNIKKYDPDFFAEIEGLLGGLDKEVKDIKQTSLNEFRDLVEQIGALWHLSRRNKQSEVDGQLVDRTEIVRELNDHIRSMNLKEFRPGLDKAVTGWEKKQMMFMGARAAFRRVEAWVDAMDGNRPGKPFRKYIWNPISDAVTKYRLEKTKYLKEYVDLIGEYKHLFNQGPVRAEGLGYTFNADRKNGSELMHAILHTGNDSNKRKLLVGRGWATIDEATGIMDSSRWDAFIRDCWAKGILTKEHYDFAQKIWNLMEKMKPAAQRAHHDMYGYYFDEITADPISTPWGLYDGGYVPAKTDPDTVTEAEMQREQDTIMGDNSFMFPTTGRGFTMKRVEYNKQLLLNLSSLAGHIDKVLKFAYIEPRVKDVARIVKTNRAFGEAMGAIDPTIRGDMLVPWLQRTAMQIISIPSTGKAGRAADKAFTWLRTNTGMQMMVGNVTNTLQQFTGIPIVITKVKAHYVRNALWQFVRAPKEATEFVSVKSDYMKTRVDNYAFEMQATMDAYLNDVNKFEKLQDFAQKHGYFLQQGTQGIVDTIAWISAYNQAVEQNLEEAEAIREADSVVRETQGSFAPEDISRIETGSAFTRMFTHFYSYFNMMANLNATEFTKTVREMGVKRGMGRLLHTYAFGFMIPAVMAEIIVQAAGGFDTGDDDEWDFWDAFCLFFGAQGRALAGMVPGIGPAIMAGFNAFNSKPYDDRISTSPAVSAMEGVVRTPFTVCKAIADDGSWKRAGKDMLTTLGIISGLPLGQLGKPVGYLADVAQGKAKPERPMDVVRGVISGKDVNRKQ